TAGNFGNSGTAVNTLVMNQSGGRESSYSVSQNTGNYTSGRSMSTMRTSLLPNITNRLTKEKPLQTLVKKKPSGRIRKWMGDLSLQVRYVLVCFFVSFWYVIVLR